MIQPVSSNRRVSMINLSSEESLTPIDVSVLARWVISPRLDGSTRGGQRHGLGVSGPSAAGPGRPGAAAGEQHDPRPGYRHRWKCARSLAADLPRGSTPGTGGFIDTVNQRLNIFHELAITTAEELSQVPLEGAAPGDTCQALGDVTTVVEDSQPLIGGGNLRR